MKILKYLSLISLLILNVGWVSESGGGVVSDQEVIVRTSIEATQVLQSNALGLFYGENRFGGAVNYSSTDSGGVFNTQNVTSSIDVVRLGNNDWMAWLKTDSTNYMKVGLSADDVYTILNDTNIVGNVSGQDVHISGVLGVSGELAVVDTNTGGNAGTDLCIGADNRLCACSSCA